MYRKHIYLLLTILFVVAGSTAHASPLTVRGADISTLLRNEQDSAIYKEYRTPTDAVQIMEHQGINLISIRLFVDPDPCEYGASMDLDMVTQLGARIKAAGFQFLLSLHYSDTWTNPGQQPKPAAWEGLSYSELVTKVHDYTRDVVAHLRTNGAMPDYVKIGNEINCGMIWPEGDVCTTGDWTVLKDFFDAATAGIDAGRGTEPMPKTIVHASTVQDLAMTQWFFGNFLATGVQVDILAESYYPEYQGDLQNLIDSLTWMEDTFPHDIILAEIADYWGGVGNATPESQKQFVIDVLDVVHDLPNNKGLGAIYWEPTWIWYTNFGYRSCFSDEPEWLDCEMTMALEVWNRDRTYPLESITIDGTVSGTSMDGHASNDYYEAITEKTTLGAPSKRISLLEHKWTIEGITDLAGRVLSVEAYKTANSEGDDFVFAWSPNDSSYTDMFTVTKTADDDTPQTFDIPMGIDKIYVRVMDTDRTGGNNSADTIYLDAMYIDYGGGPPDNTPPSPDPMTWATVPYATGSTSIAMQATTASDESGVEYYFTCTSGGGHDSGWMDGTSYEDEMLDPDSTYIYTVKARDKSANQNETAESTAESATTEAPQTPITIVNPSFEVDGEQTDFSPTGWTWNGGGQNGTYAPGGTNGIYMYWHGNSAVLYQTTGHTITVEGVPFELLVDVHNSWQADPAAIIYYLDGANRVALGSASLPANGDTWPTWETLTVTGLSTAASVGKNVGVELTIGNYPGDYWCDYDYVRLSYGSPCESTSMHVDSIVCSAVSGNPPNKYGQVTVTIKNDCGGAVAGVDVTGTFTGDFNEQVTETTNPSGVAVLTTSTQAKKPSYTFCVDDVTGGSLPYNPDDNVETCDSY